jgi:hypothetical protein
MCVCVCLHVCLNSARHLIGSRILEPAAYCNQKLLALYILAVHKTRYLNHSVFVITFTLDQSNSIKRCTLYISVRVCVCMCVSVCVCVGLYFLFCLCLNVKCAHVSVILCVYLCVMVCIFLCVYVCGGLYFNVCVCVCAYMCTCLGAFVFVFMSVRFYVLQMFVYICVFTFMLCLDNRTKQL